MKVHKPAPKTRKSFWKGPLEDGITFSLLNRFLECRERFRLRVVEGLVDDEGFNRSMEYGSMWHESEAALATKGGSWLKAAQSYRDKLIAKYPDSQAEIIHWYCVLKAEFPHYITRWQAQHKANQSLLQEVAFRVPYTLPSGRSITLRGKWDQVFLRKKNIWLQENKTKGEIDEEGIMATVDENLQVMFYLIALETVARTDGGGFFSGHRVDMDPKRLAGVLYNVIRRPLADRYAIRQKKSETKKQFYERLSAEIKSKPDHYFKRWEANIGPTDIKKFKRECFDPILEGLMDWWDSIVEDPFDPWYEVSSTHDKNVPGIINKSKIPNRHHWRTPFGIYHSLAGGFRGSYFNYITKQSSRDLRTITTLYPELED